MRHRLAYRASELEMTVRACGVGAESGLRVRSVAHIVDLSGSRRPSKLGKEDAG